jgi:hypothetical protein
MQESVLKTAEQLCRDVEMACNYYNHAHDVKDDMDNYPWISKDSDHLPQFLNLKGKVKLVSWNCLNSRYLHWMQSNIVDGKDTTQGLSHIFSGVKSNEDERLKKNAGFICGMLLTDRIVCLQEASEALLTEINLTMKAHELTMFKEARGEDNYNVVMSMSTHYDIFEYSKSSVSADKFKNYGVINRETNFEFLLANVHMKFGTNPQYAADFLEFYKYTGKTMPYVVCGDFNASSRWPKKIIEGDHIVDVYSDPVFKFVNNEPGPVFSHVNTYKNVKTRAEQIDKFDHIIIMGMK